MKGIQLILSEVEAESQDTVAGDAVQFLLVSQGPVLGCVSELVKLERANKEPRGSDPVGLE